MNARYALLPAMFLLGFLIMLPLGLAADFSAANVGTSTINISATNYRINITISNQDASANITQVNLALWSFTFFNNSDSTSSNAFFSNSSATTLNWTNETGLINTGGAHSFVFNVSAPSEDGSYNITVNVTDTSGVSNVTNITYSVVALFSLAFNNYTVMQQSSNTIQNLSYNVSITNNGAGAEIYNLSVVNCSNTNQAGTGTLNTYSVTLNAQGTAYVQLNMSSSTPGLYSSCIMANHWNGASMNTTWNFTSNQNSVILNSSFYPDLAVPAIYWNATGNNQHPYSGGNISVYAATINNTGHFNFTGNVTVYLVWDSTLVDNISVENTSLGNGTSLNISFSNITGITSGLRNLTVWADALGGVSESNELNNNYTTQVFVGYNITVSVLGQSGVNTTTAKNITLNVTVKYGNGDPVTNLGKENFTIYDSQSGETISLSNYVLNTTFVNGSGYYLFNISSHSPANNTDTLPGIHNLTVQATNNESGRVYSGNNTGSPYYYLLVPRFTITFSASSWSFTEITGSRAVTINVTNTGTDSIYNVTITHTGESPLSLTALSGCTKTMSNNMLGVQESVTCQTTATSGDISSTSEANIQATATGQHNNTGGFVTYYRNGFQLLTVNVASSGTTGDTDGGDGGGGNTTARVCASDSVCGANESCVNRRCTAISCSDGEILDHVCFKFSYKINITSFESALTAVSGESASTKVTVKNTGTRTLTAKLDVTLSSVTATVSPASYSLGTGESYQFTVNFTVPNSTTVGNFSGTFKAYVSTSTGFYESKSFVFTVLPREETKTAINVSYQELSSMLANISGQLSQMKASGRYNQSVISSIESLVSAAISKLDSMKSAIDSGDYVSAQSLISQINSSLSSAEITIEGAPAEQAGSSLGAIQGSIWFWVAIVVIVIFVVGFFVYMFLPSREGRVQKTYQHPEPGKEGGGIRGIFSRKKGIPETIKTVSDIEKPEEEGRYETFHYSEGYKKEKSFDYDYKNKGIRGVFRKLKRKKDKKESPQMHIDQFTNSVTE